MIYFFKCNILYCGRKILYIYLLPNLKGVKFPILNVYVGVFCGFPPAMVLNASYLGPIAEYSIYKYFAATSEFSG